MSNARSNVAPLIVAAVAFAAAIAAVAPASAQPVPVIERIEPTSGPVGTQVEIIGRRIHPHSTVKIGNVPVEVVRRLPNRWTVRIPQGAQTGNIVIETRWGTTQGPLFRVTTAAPAPVIEGIDPTSGPPGTTVTIRGQNFSARVADNTVTLSGRPVVVRMANPTSLQVIVPEGATTGPFVVSVRNAGQAESAPFTVGAATAISGFEPRVGPPGTQVTITGNGFSANTRDNRVYINNVACQVVSSTPTQIVVRIPPRAATGPLLVDVRNGGRIATTTPFTVQLQPTIASFEPTNAAPGQLITIRGTNFGTDPRVVNVKLNGRDVVLRRVTATEIQVEIPTGATSGTFVVTVNGIAATSRQTFTVLVPLAIRDFQPRSGPVGTNVTITGTGFSERANENTVKISNVAAPVVSASATQLVVRIPQAPSGPIEITVPNSGTVRTSDPFTVTVPPFIASFEPQLGAPGTEVTIRGRNFGTNASLVQVTIAGRPMQVRSVADDRIVAVIPEGATTGRIQVTVRMHGTGSASADFRVVDPFRITAIEPQSAYPGVEVTVRGVGFPARGARIELTGARPIDATYVSPTELKFVVPEGVQAGPVVVRLPDGRAARSAQVLAIGAAPSGTAITAIEAQCTRPGCVAILRGHGFSPRNGFNRVRFANRPVRVRRATATTLEIDLPPAPDTTSTFEITVRNGGQATSQPFTMTH